MTCRSHAVPFLTAAFLAASLHAQTTIGLSFDQNFANRSTHPSVSYDGRYAVYQTFAPAGGLQVVLYDFQSGSTGIAANPGEDPVISGDGSTIAFQRLGQIWVVPRAGGTPRMVSVSSAGVPSDRGGLHAAISGDGRYVAFQTTATNLISPPPPVSNVYNVYVHDTLTAVTTLVSEAFAGGAGAHTSSYPWLSATGRYVAFQSFSPDLLPPGADTNGAFDVFVRDRDPDGNGTFDEGNAITVRVSLTETGGEPNAGCAVPHISADGRFVVFESNSSNIVPSVENRNDIFLHDRDPDGNGDFYDVPGTTELISVDVLGADGFSECQGAAVSNDGRFVAFSGHALVRNSINNWEVYVHDRTSGWITRASVDSAGNAPDGASGAYANRHGLAFAGDGRRVVFISSATNLVPGDTNGFIDVFAHDVCPSAARYLADGVAGFAGLIPAFSVCGDLSTGGTGLHRLRDARPLAPAFLVASLTQMAGPAIGSGLTSGSAPMAVALTTDANGVIETPVPGGAGPLHVFARWVIADAAAPAGLAFSNALDITFP